MNNKFIQFGSKIFNTRHVLYFERLRNNTLKMWIPPQGGSGAWWDFKEQFKSEKELEDFVSSLNQSTTEHKHEQK